MNSAIAINEKSIFNWEPADDGRDFRGVFGRLAEIGNANYSVVERIVGKPNMIHLVFCSPHVRSYASLVLLNEQYARMDTERSEKNNWKKWVIFRYRYLKQIKERDGELVCEYCGKRDLHISMKKTGGNSKLATLDHIKPLSHDGDRYNPKNLAVACLKCNQEKGPRDFTMRIMMKRNPIKYLLISLKNSLCTFLRFLGLS